MKAQNMKLYVLLSLLLTYHISSLSYTTHDIVHQDSELAKVCTLDNKDVLVLSSVRGKQQTMESRLDKTGRVVYGNMTLPQGYTGNAQLVEPHSVNGNQSNFFLYFHNKQSVSGALAKEMTMEFNKGDVSRNSIRRDNIFSQKSVVALKSGLVFVAGLEKDDAFGAHKDIEVNLFDPVTNEWGSGLTFREKGFSKFMSCYEQKENDVYCVFVSYEDVYVSKLRIKHLKVNTNAMSLSATDAENKQVIKNFYTEFNFVKAIPFNEKEAIVVFQTGNGKQYPKYGNTGKDLYYYHLVVNGDSVSVKRYEYLYDQCEKADDSEDYKVDVAVLSEKRVYVACETGSGRFRGFIIYPLQDQIEEFNFNNFDAESVKNPAFAKFDKSLGIFYTHNTDTLNSRVAFHLMNYPDCLDYRDKPFLLPKHFSKDDFDFSGKVFMNNPYPASRADEEIKVRFKKYANLTIVNKKDMKNIVDDQDYNSKLNLRVTSDGKEKYYAVEYTATREDPLDGLIIGKTCKINFFTPQCLPQCYSCTKKGNETNHYCLGCESDHYYEEKDESAVNDGWGIPHNCHRCNDSCSTCYGASFMKPIQTTNCKKCDYENGYYHYEFDERTCISNETQESWEKYLNQSIYIDTTPGPEHKDKWRWRHCHYRCHKCHGPGDDVNNNCDECKEEQGFYFFCNQTIGNGIPGSCHDGCVDNGFYLKESEGMQKCCPCSVEHCQKCRGNPLCDVCYPPFFRLPGGENCVEECPYCLAEDRQKWRCVNCKTEYDKEMYTLNKTCVDESKLPITINHPHFYNRSHHVVDPQCNLLIGCKDGCFKCDGWYTENCTECKKGYYKEDFFGLTQPKTFRCFKEEECQGVKPYQFDEELQVGGVPRLVNGEEVCYNCRLREGNYRQVENNFVCGPLAKRTYVNITHYYKLSPCYLRCASCNGWGGSCYHNCTSCRDPSLYELKEYKDRPKYGDCIRYTHKCKNLPYYHDYDLAKELGVDEDNCGQDCDVCLTNGTCTENFPYFVIDTRECVERCPLTDILTQTCLMNHTNAGYILLENPFDLPNTYYPINQTITINQIISSAFFEKFAKYYNLDVNTVSNEINNVLGNGKIFNLPNSEVIIGNNISIELTSVKLELEKLAELLSGKTTTETTNTTSILDISECEEVLKKKYGLKDEEQLMIIKGDTLKQLSEQYLGNQVDYQLFSTSLGAFLPLKDCKEKQATVTITNPFNIENLFSQLASKTGSVINNGYDAFSSESPFYNDVCTPFTNENGNDVLLDERRSDYFNEVLNICEKGCTFIEYNPNSHLYSCKCPVKDQINGQNDNQIVSKELPESFYKKHKNSNIEVFKCSSQVFSSQGQKNNFGSYVLLACLTSFIGVVAFYIIKGPAKIVSLFNNLATNSIIANPPKTKAISTKVDPNENKQPGSSKEYVQQEKDDNKSIINQEPLNNADYNLALDKDHRGYLKLYWSFLKMKQLLIFTFYTYTDYNLRIAKIALFILFVSFYFAFTALFFNDSIMRQIYIYKGNTDAAVHVPNIILSSLCCLIMNFIIRFVSLSERDIAKINNERNENIKRDLCEKTKKALKIKLIILFVISGVLIALCWYYVSAFCAVFKNSQGHYFVNVLVAFIVCNLWPCVTSLIPPLLRIKGLKGKSPCMYKASQIIAYI